MRQDITRAFSAFLGGFGLLGILGEWIRPGLSLNLWWIDLRFLPDPLGEAFLAAASATLVAFSVAPKLSVSRRCATLAALLPLFAACAYNAMQFYLLEFSGLISNPMHLPASALIAAGLAWTYLEIWRTKSPPNARPAFSWKVPAFLTAFVFTFPVMQMLCFGKTDYRRAEMDAIVVFGGRVYADGRPSDALADRMNTAIALYHESKAPLPFLSGGPGDGAFHETDVMQGMAVAQGVPVEAILLDRDGWNTAATVRNAAQKLGLEKSSRVLAVSHFYHLPRIKMAFQAEGVEAFTVPAKENYLLTKMPIFMAREVVAYWAYLGKALLPAS